MYFVQIQLKKLKGSTNNQIFGIKGLTIDIYLWFQFLVN